MSEPFPDLPAAIRARSERQAMDWSLVLASQGIEVTLDRDPLDGVWCLLVAPAEEPRARAAIRQYRIENRGFEWQRELPGSDYLFDGRVVFWALAIAFVFLLTGGSDHAGIFDTQLVRQGQWWRAFTAEWLHRDVAHLFSNLAMGMLFLGLAMARFGAGVALLGSLLAGALANGVGLLLRGEDYLGLGASGLVMGALGMVIAQAVPRWRSGRRGNRVVLTSLGTGALLFILLGTDPSTDVLAHTAGLVFGIIFGAIAAWLPLSVLNRANPFALAAFLLLALGTGFMALMC
ncbi:MAG TPA: rhomboid family intramembrane serine protease [Verrucomicrobiota bacterium]|nr:hypothetical protein [Verrucomicrobiales bacterium]HRI13982.1 rhomboid family intramembrane serine protease [Verrucomicrobiota bacterium]